MAAKKTVHVEFVRGVANRMLADSADDKQEGRIAVAIMLEAILMDTGNYKGFQYLGSEYLPAAEQTHTNVLRDNYDDTRRMYF